MDLDQQLERAMCEERAITPESQSQWDEMNTYQRRQVARVVLTDVVHETAPAGIPLTNIADSELSELLVLRESFRPRGLREAVPTKVPEHEIVAQLHDALPVDHEDAPRVAALHRRGAALDRGERDEAQALGAKHASLLDDGAPADDDGQDWMDMGDAQPGLESADDDEGVLGAVGASLSKESDGGRAFLRESGIPTTGGLGPVPAREVEPDRRQWRQETDDELFGRLGIPMKVA